MLLSWALRPHGKEASWKTLLIAPQHRTARYVRLSRPKGLEAMSCVGPGLSGTVKEVPEVSELEGRAPREDRRTFKVTWEAAGDRMY